MNREEFDLLCNTKAGNKWRGGGEEKTLEHETYSWWMQQNQHEFFDLLSRLQEKQVKTILEVGSSHGGSLVFYDHIVGEDGLVIGMENAPEYAFSVIRQSGYTPKSNIKLLEMVSHLNSTLTAVKKSLNKRPLDFLFIDGDHSYEGAKQDYEMYMPLVKEGGLIGFHDAAIEPRVSRLLDEITLPKEMLPIHFMGIMLIQK